MSLNAEQRIRGHLQFLYGEAEAKRLWPMMQSRLASFAERNPRLQQAVEEPLGRLTEHDAILITYGDQFQEGGTPPLQTLHDFAVEHLATALNAIHILPFYPYSSDDGFSVIDYRAVDPDLGDWDDIARLGEDFRLMFDAVINHISRESQWFQAFLRGEPPYRDYFITVDPDMDLSMVVRPRALPLLTRVVTAEGERHVWTTFSEDQVDLDFANPQVLLEIVDLLLFYVAKGAEIIRLDAIAYLWKEAGTTSIHLPKTHYVVKLFRAVMDTVAPGVILITETNVPHEENISYFGESMGPGEGLPQGDEAQMVYQFPLAPLVLHTFRTGNARVLAEWIDALEVPYPTATFFNFIASHDGIGVRPAEGLLSTEEIQALVDTTEAHGGQVSYKTNKDGSKSVYELNLTLYDFLNDPGHPEQVPDVQRFLASQALMLSLAGVPGIYVHSLFGSRNCYVCLEETGRARSINREKFQRGAMEDRLADPHTNTAQVFAGYKRLLEVRREHPAFHPNAGQSIVDLGAALFALKRTSLDEAEHILCLINVTPDEQEVSARLDGLGFPQLEFMRDLISGDSYPVSAGGLRLKLNGYQYVWLTRK